MRGDESIAWGCVGVGFDGAEEAGFFDVGSAVFRTEGVAVSAFVAEVGVACDLHFFGDFELAGGGLDDAAVGLDDVVGVVERGDGGGVGEIGCVGADGDAFVAGDAIEHVEV